MGNYQDGGGGGGGGTFWSPLRGSIVLCVHGIFGGAGSFQGMFKEIEKTGYYNDYNACVPIKEISGQSIQDEYCVLTSENISSIKGKLKAVINDENNGNKNLFFKVVFSKPKLGFISNQKDELSIIVDIIKEIILESTIPLNYRPIITLGHSKGGLVNMNCALKNKNISKLISVGTPYDGTIFDFICQLAGNAMLDSLSWGVWGFVADIANKLGANTNYLFDELAQWILQEHIVDNNILSKWNKAENRPTCTIIGTDAIEFQYKASSFSGDYVVPVKSSATNRLTGVLPLQLDNYKATLIPESIMKKIMRSKEMEDLCDYLVSLIKKTPPEDAFEVIINKFFTALKVGIPDFKDSLRLAHCPMFGSSYSELNDHGVLDCIMIGLGSK